MPRIVACKVQKGDWCWHHILNETKIRVFLPDQFYRHGFSRWKITWNFDMSDDSYDPHEQGKLQRYVSIEGSLQRYVSIDLQ
jgi:hypothetical protein